MDQILATIAQALLEKGVASAARIMDGGVDAIVSAGGVRIEVTRQ